MADDERRASRLTLAQRDMLNEIVRTGMPEGGRGWTSHSQRRLDSLVRRGLAHYAGDGRWRVGSGDDDAFTPKQV
jgi:hypothetical protein